MATSPEGILPGAGGLRSPKAYSPATILRLQTPPSPRPVAAQPSLCPLPQKVVWRWSGVEPGRLAQGQGDELAEPAVGGVVADLPVVRSGDEGADDRRPAGGQGVGV